LKRAAEAFALALRGARHGEDDPADIVPCRQRIDIARGMHAQPLDRQRLQVRVIVDKGHGTDRVIAGKRRGKLPSGAPRPVDQHASARIGGVLTTFRRRTGDRPAGRVPDLNAGYETACETHRSPFDAS